MKQTFFVKFAPQIKKLTGCSRSTEILGKLEYWFSKYPDGFYKFIEPCSHRLYRGGDSWTEELDCDRKSFSSSFDKIAIRYKSRRAFEESEDKFQNKMYASFYDRYTNQTYFVRNHILADAFLAEILPSRKKVAIKEVDLVSKEADLLISKPLRNGKYSRSYKEAKNTPKELLRNNSHASNEIINKMIELWTAIVEEGRGHIELNSKRVAFLKQAFKDKFDNCLEKWKYFCQEIARSRFLMGEKTSWKASLDWAIKFDSINKILDGNYGIGDREPKLPTATVQELQEEIDNLEEPIQIKQIRSKLLSLVGNAHYISWFKPLRFEFRGQGTLVLVAPSSFSADYLKLNYDSILKQIFATLDSNLTMIVLFANDDPRERACFNRDEKVGKAILVNTKLNQNPINLKIHPELEACHFDYPKEEYLASDKFDEAEDKTEDYTAETCKDEDQSLIKSAIQSLLNANMGRGQGGILNDYIPY